MEREGEGRFSAGESERSNDRWVERDQHPAGRGSFQRWPERDGRHDRQGEKDLRPTRRETPMASKERGGRQGEGDRGLGKERGKEREGSF